MTVINLARLSWQLLPLALRKAPGLPADQQMPRIDVDGRMALDATWLRDYRAIVGNIHHAVVPACVPQVLAAGVHRQLLMDPRFPFAAMGLVHIGNRIDELASLQPGMQLHVHCHTGALRAHAKGAVFSLHTDVQVDGAVVWRATTDVLRRGVRLAGATADASNDAPRATSRVLCSSVVTAAADIGRRYAPIAGDANPIHLHALTAKPLGFPRAIAHGMWTLARALSEVDAVLPSIPRRIDARFVRPLLLPGRAVVTASQADSTVVIGVTPPKAHQPPHMTAVVSSIA
jgi:acyl dehydratase